MKSDAWYTLGALLLLAQGACSKPVVNSPAASQERPIMLPLRGDLRVHDPAMVRQNDTFYIFSTGGRRGIIPIRTSRDMHNWSRGGSVFTELPAWVHREIPDARGAWAPDISFFNGKYHLYYSVSTYGQNNSAIGLATNQTLDPNDHAYRWEDQGLVTRSTAGRHDWNAIDGNLVLAGKEQAWLCWGSFWSGIKMRRIDYHTGKLSQKDTTLYALAERPRAGSGDTASVGAVEAPFLVQHEGYWYLFVSFDHCCRGVDSTYRIMVGRSSEITGPYFDREGKAMLNGGGTLVLQATDADWRGPGHCAVIQEGSGDYLVFHAYQGQTGRAELKISTLLWQEEWPRVGELN